MEKHTLLNNKQAKVVGSSPESITQQPIEINSKIEDEVITLEPFSANANEKLALTLQPNKIHPLVALWVKHFPRLILPNIPFRMAIFIAVLVHVLIIVAASVYWKVDTSNLLIPPAADKPAIKSYTITQEELQQLIDKAEQSSKPKTIIEPVDAKHKDEQPKSESAADDKPVPQTQRPAQSVEQAKVIDMSDTPELPNREMNNDDSPETGVSIAQQDENNFTPTNNINNSYHFTKQYLSKQYNRELDTMISQQHAAGYGPTTSLSEMDGEGVFIEIQQVREDKLQQHTYNHRLDPNRIVKIGDDCYRVVPLPTQINPHGEGLGFKEPCSGDKVQAAMNEAIKNRLIMLNKIKD